MHEVVNLLVYVAKATVTTFLAWTKILAKLNTNETSCELAHLQYFT